MSGGAAGRAVLELLEVQVLVAAGPNDFELLATLALAGIAPFAFDIWRTCSSCRRN